MNDRVILCERGWRARLTLRLKSNFEGHNHADYMARVDTARWLSVAAMVCTLGHVAACSSKSANDGGPANQAGTAAQSTSGATTGASATSGPAGGSTATNGASGGSAKGGSSEATGGKSGAMMAAANGGSGPSKQGGGGAGSGTPANTNAGAGAGGGTSPSGAGGMGSPSFCSGCSQENPNKMDMTVHLHHVHLNVTSRETTEQFYEKHLGAKRIKLNDTSEALHTEPVMLLMDETATPPDSNLPTALQHVGWGSSDVGAWYDKAHQDGVEPDTRAGFTLFNTNDTPTIGEKMTGGNPLTLFGMAPPPCVPESDNFSYMYVLGPDKERIEVWSGADLRVNHVHFTTPDVTMTSSWYTKFLGMPANSNINIYLVYVDDILFFFEPIGVASDYKPTDDHSIGHIAFSVTDLGAWMQRAQDQKVEVVAPPAPSNGFMSFFVRGPDGLLVELVQAEPLKELCPPSAAMGGSAGTGGMP